MKSINGKEVQVCPGTLLVLGRDDYGIILYYIAIGSTSTCRFIGGSGGFNGRDFNTRFETYFYATTLLSAEMVP